MCGGAEDRFVLIQKAGWTCKRGCTCAVTRRCGTKKRNPRLIPWFTRTDFISWKVAGLGMSSREKSQPEKQKDPQRSGRGPQDCALFKVYRSSRNGIHHAHARIPTTTTAGSDVGKQHVTERTRRRESPVPQNLNAYHQKSEIADGLTADVTTASLVSVQTLSTARLKSRSHCCCR